MNPKKLYIACFTITMLIFSLSLYNVISYYSKDNQILESVTYTDNSNLISVYIEDEDGNYVLSETSNFDQGTDYVYNEEKSYCVNESVLSYNEETSKISVTASGSDNCYVYFDAEPKVLLSEQILMNEGNSFDTVEVAITYIYNKDTPDFSETATTDEGIFATEDNDGMSYYFRGATEDNYVLFADMLWRIIRIDGNDNIKLMLYNEDSEAKKYQEYGITGSYNVYFTSETLLSGALSYNEGTESYSAKIIVETWYTSNLTKYSDYLVSINYCIDMDEQSYSTVSGSKVTTYYGTYDRLVYTENSPSLECDTTKIGIYEYEYSVGLISADEVVFAGGVYGSSNLTYYLNTGYDYLGISLFSYYLGPGNWGGTLYSLLINSSGAWSEELYNTGYAIFPTVSLSSETLFKEGSGTITDPYIVG